MKGFPSNSSNVFEVVGLELFVVQLIVLSMSTNTPSICH
jgi:hypothetical protein